MAIQEVEVRVKPVFDGLVVWPGDTLVMRVDPNHRWTRGQVDRWVDELKERLPGVKVVVVDQLVIYRPEPEKENRDGLRAKLEAEHDEGLRRATEAVRRD